MFVCFERTRLLKIASKCFSFLDGKGQASSFFSLKHLFGTKALIICLIALMVAAGGGGGDVAVGGHGGNGPTYYAGPGLYWWYMPPMYIHTGSGGRLFDVTFC